MLKKLLVLAVLGFSTLAQAGDPCAPTVQAMESRMACKKGNVYYSITFNTLMSPNRAECRGSRYQEITSAKIRVSDKQGDLGSIDLLPGSFKAGWALPGMPSTFDANAFFIHLENCATPAHGGGMSAHN